MNKTTLTTLLLFTFFSLTVIAQDTEDTVYVSASGAGLSDGSSEANAYGNFGNALGQINSEGDKLVIIGTITSNGANLTTKNFSFTIEGLDANSIITGASGAKRLFTINGPTSANVTFKDLTFSSNSTTLGGGSVLFSNNAGATVTFNNCTITNNSVTNAAGGGALFFANGTLNIIDSSFENNTSSDEGGAIFGNSGTIIITNSLFKSNSAATKGGALYANSANFVITSSTFYDNQTTNATAAGGSVLYVATTGSTNTITNCTFFQNTTGSANQDFGTIRTDNGNTTVSNSLFYDNKTNNSTGGPSDWGAGTNGTQTFETSIAQWISTYVDNQDEGAGSITGIKGNLGTPANLTSSNLTFNSTLGKVVYDAVNVGENSPIDFGSDGNDVGAWDSGFSLVSPDTTPPVITLNGDPTVTVEVGASYTDAGAAATDNYDDDTALSSNIITVNTVDTDIVASYTLTYNVSDVAGNAATEVTRTVNVVDTTVPVITLTGLEIVTIEVGSTYTDGGATATDNYDDDTALSSNIITVNTVDTDIVASYTLTYNVSDVAGNAATEVTRTVNVVDTSVPVTYFVKAGGNNSGGLSEENAFTTVNNAVVAASDGDTIIIVGSINQTGQVGVGKSISFVGQTNATITGAGARMYVINAAGKTISFTNITFQDATTTNPGAVITITQSSDLTLTDCVFKNNVSTVNGGTILAGGTGVLTITNSLFDGNSANRGGAIAITTVGRQLIITGSTFVNNSATGLDGGALYLGASNTESSITNTTIFNNSVEAGLNQSKGGGIKIEGTRPFTIQNSLVYGNYVTDGATDLPSDISVIASVELSLINSLSKKIVSLGVNDSFVSSIVAADLTASNLSFDSTTGNVIYDAVAEGTDSPIDFGSDGEDVGSWNSGLNFLDTTVPVITLNGDPTVTVEVGTPYADAGATATDIYDDDTALSLNIITVNTVDTDIVASYTLTYNVSDVAGNAATEVTRTVNVVDTTAPVITLTGLEIVTIEVGSTYTDGGATATDNYDDDTTLTASIVTDVSVVVTGTVGSYTVNYNVSDVATNAAIEVTRTVNVVDTTVPVITLTGLEIVTIEVGSTYTDAGAAATDNYDDDTALSSNIITVTTVDTDIVASFTLTYNVSDVAGNAAIEVTRTVNVVDTTVPVITLNGDPTVTVEVGASYTDAGAAATDNYDDDTALSSNIITVNTVDTDIVASYTLTYNVSDASGNAAIEVTRTVIVEDSSLSSIDGDNETLKVIMYPNPTSDKIHIKGLNTYDLKVYNRLGQLILKANNTHTIDVSALSVGIYLLEVSDGVKSSTKRFAKY
jgi:predicted outer membrane repeat protein